MNKRLLLLASVLVQAFTLLLLAIGSSLLLVPVLGTALPLGNLLTWLLLTLFPTNFLLVRRAAPVHRVPRGVFFFCVYAGLVLGFLWLPASRLLAGNWTNTFQGGDVNQQVWTYYTFAAAVLPFAGYFLMRFLSSFFRVKT